MLARVRIATSLVTLLALAGVPTAAQAAVDVTRDATSGELRVTATGTTAERLTVSRADDATLRIVDLAGGVTSSDASCTIDAASGAASCTTASPQPMVVSLAGGSDQLDATAASGLALKVDGGAGADRLRLGSTGTTTVTGTDALDTFDLSHADAAVRVRYETRARRVVARCAECAGGWAVTLPVQPRAVLLGGGDDDVDLRAWRTIGRTTWTTGAGADRVLGSRVRRSVMNTGSGADVLLSWAPADVLRAGTGPDKLADFGGSGDLLDGGADIDIAASLDGKRDTMRGGAGRDMCPSLRRPTSTCDTSGRVSSFEMSLYLPLPTQQGILTGVLGVFL